MSQSTRTTAADRRDARAAAAAPDASGVFTHRQIITILAGLLLGMFLAALDQTVVSTAIRTIADDLQGYDLQAWATTAFLITSTITTPLYGKLSDLYGRRPFYLFAIGVFVVGSMLCGLADSMYQLAAFRALQGIGAGGLMSLALAIIGDIVPPRERSKYQGFFMAVFGTSSVLGPVIGGFLAGQDTILGITGWRWIFYVNVPLGILAFAVVWRVLHLPHQRREHRIDWPGALALVVTLVPLLIVAEQGRDLGLGLRPGAALLRDRHRRADRLHPGRAGLQGRRAAPPAAVQEPQLRRRQRRQHRAGRRHVRRDPAAPAVPADRARLQPHGRRPADDPAGRRHHGRRDGLRHRDQQDRQVQDLPAGRHRLHRRWRWSRCRSSSTPTPRCGRLVPFMVLLGVGLGLQLPAGHPGRAERRLPAGDGRGHVVGHVLPPDGRHDRCRGVPVDPVHPAAAPRSADAFRRRGASPRSRGSVDLQQPVLQRHVADTSGSARR